MSSDEIEGLAIKLEMLIAKHSVRDTPFGAYDKTVHPLVYACIDSLKAIRVMQKELVHHQEAIEDLEERIEAIEDR